MREIRVTETSKWGSEIVGTRLRELAPQCQNTTELLGRLGYSRSGGSRQYLVAALRYHDIDFSHFTTRKPQTFKRIPLSQILVEHSTHSRNTVKRRLLQEGLLKNICSLCELGPEWNGKPINMRLDHISGVSDDNRLINLRMICPNCDSQLPTYCGRNQGENSQVRVPHLCACGNTMHPRSQRCRACSNKERIQGTKIVWPPVEELRTQIRVSSYSAVARRLGVSDNAVRKHLTRISG